MGGGGGKNPQAEHKSESDMCWVKLLTSIIQFLYIIIPTLLAEFACNNLLPRHFQLFFILPSVIPVSDLCLGLTLLLKCRVQKLRLDSRPPVLFDQFDRFILFWRGFQAITSKNFSQSEYVAVFNLRETIHCPFHYVNLSNICSQQASHSMNLSDVRFFTVG